MNTHESVGDQPKSALQEKLSDLPKTTAALDEIFNSGKIEGSFENFVAKVSTPEDVKLTMQIVEKYLNACEDSDVRIKNAAIAEVGALMDRLYS
ncbi:MAG: hypothetical protein AAB391_02910 [Patescibacteria group bacterium]